MMAQRATDGVVLCGMLHVAQKLRHNKAPRSFFDVLSKSPPAVVIRGLDVAIRTCKERDLLFDPVRRLGIVNEAARVTGVVTVEGIDIVAKACRIQDAASVPGVGASTAAEGCQCSQSTRQSLAA